MHTSERGVALIKRFEGFPNGGRPYRDPVGVWTIGYGHTEGVGPHSKRLTQRQADALLRHDLAVKYEGYVNRLYSYLHRHQNRFDALVSAVYNLGGGVLDRGRSLGDAVRAGHGVRAAFMQYVNAGGRPLPGLVRRRRAEANMYLNDRPVETPEQRKVRLWRRRLTLLRAYVRVHGGVWAAFPKRKKLAEELKRDIKAHSHPKKKRR